MPNPCSHIEIPKRLNDPVGQRLPEAAFLHAAGEDKGAQHVATCRRLLD